MRLDSRGHKGTSARVVLITLALACSHFGFGESTALATSVEWFWSGAITDSSAQVNARLNADSLVVRLVVSESPQLDFPTFSQADTVFSDQNNRIARLVVRGLNPVSQYYYAFEVNGEIDSTMIGRFRTFPATAASFTIALGSCAQTGSQHQVFETIRSLDPDFFFHLGDMHYQNIGVNNINLYRNAFESVLASASQSALYRDVPLAYIWDDHDYGPNNSDSTSASRPAARSAYQEYVPHYPLAFGSGNVPINYAFSYGRVRFIVCDSRSARSPAFSPDNPSKTMLGVAQKNWFKQELLWANGRYPLIVWVNSLPWIGSTGDDGWYLYTHERRELADFIKNNKIRGLCMVSGDAHMLAIDNGTHSDYATGGGASFPVLHAAALDQSGSVKGGPYSHGAFPSGGQFALMTVTDQGDSTITVSWSGRNYQNSQIVSYSFSVPAHSIVCGDADGDGVIQLADAVLLVNYVFIGGPPPDTQSNGDADSNRMISISDAIYLIRYLFIGGPTPACD